jgi:hypothetical protein
MSKKEDKEIDEYVESYINAMEGKIVKPNNIKPITTPNEANLREGDLLADILLAEEGLTTKLKIHFVVQYDNNEKSQRVGIKHKSYNDAIAYATNKCNNKKYRIARTSVRSYIDKKYFNIAEKRIESSLK